MKSARYLLIALIGSPFINSTATAQQAAPKPLFKPWAPIAEKDIVWRRREWREIDAQARGNEAFLFSKNNPEVPSLADQLISGILSGDINAYSATNDRFTTTLNGEEFPELVRSSGIQSFTKYQVKEDSLSVGVDGRMEVRILGLAPIGIVKDDKGNPVERPLFWIYYPDARKFLSKSVALHGGNKTTWDAILEGRQFESSSIKANDKFYRMDKDKQ